MTTEQLIANYSPIGDVISIVTCAVLLVLILRALSFLKDAKFVYLESALHFILIGACANIGFFLLIKSNRATVESVIIARDLYHFGFFLCLYCYILYMKKMLDIKGTLTSIFTYITRAIFVCTFILDILSPFTKFGFYYENGEWHDPILSPYNLFYAYMVLLLLGTLIFNAKRLIKSVRYCLIVAWLAVAVIMIYQAFKNCNSYTSFTYVLPLLVVMILLHSKPYDDKTGSLSLNSFESFVKDTVQKNLPADYVALKFNTSMFDHMPEELGKVMNSFWYDSFKNAVLFNLTSDLFIFAIPKNDKNGNTEEKFNKLIEGVFQNYYKQYKLSYKIVGLFGIDFIENAGDVAGIVSYLLRKMEDNTSLMVDDKMKKDLRVYKLVRNELEDIEKQGNLDDPRILAYCQPIRNMKTGEFDTAEALMRMDIPGYGMVMPFFFIPIAEDYNYIHLLTKIMLNKVCRQIRELEAGGYQFKRISVNFTASEIRAEDFCDETIRLIVGNGVEPSKIGIELTESQSDSDFKIVQQKIKVLRDAGMTVYLDDIGTGYSNLDRIVRYDVDVVKFDRFFLLEAEKSVKIVKMLMQLSQAFRDLDYKLLYEGVETEGNEALCMSCGADYIQGFKYSKPIPIEEYKNFLKSDKTGPAITFKAITKKIENSDKTDFSFTEMKDQYSILITMSKLYYSMHVIDLVNNTARPYNPTEDVKVTSVVNSSIGADQMMSQIMRMCTVDQHVDAVLKFSDLTTIADRMKGKKILESDEYMGKSIGWYVAAFYTIETDEEDRPTKVLYTTRSVDERKKKEDMLIYKSNTDELTGLYNRWAYEDKLKELIPSSGLKDDFVYISITVNGLKAANDSFGHEAGDELLSGASECLRKSIGSYGDLYRIGGGEFVALLNVSDSQLEEIKENIKKTTADWKGKFTNGLSIAYGIARKSESAEMSLHDVAVLANQRKSDSKAE